MTKVARQTAPIPNKIVANVFEVIALFRTALAGGTFAGMLSYERNLRVRVLCPDTYFSRYWKTITNIYLLL